jgi:hypothetical protein
LTNYPTIDILLSCAHNEGVLFINPDRAMEVKCFVSDTLTINGFVYDTLP